jgi:hypothetical protein
MLETNFSLMQHHKYSLTELENMIPWEREIYVDMLVEHLKEEKKRQEEQQRN